MLAAPLVVRNSASASALTHLSRLIEEQNLAMETSIRLRTLRAWAIHLYTASGLVFALLALGAIVANDARLVFIYLGIALFIDATDGALARRWQVKIWAPHFDGRKLDDITDYINYTFLPAFFAYHFGLITGVGGMVVLGVMVLAGVYGFCQSEAKTSDGYFTGWPNFWNLLILYLYIFNRSPEFNGIVILVCAALIFVPVKYVSFSTRPLRRVTRVLSLLYGVVLYFIVVDLRNAPPMLLALSLVFPLYYLVLSLLLNLKSDWQTNAAEKLEPESH